MNDTPTNSDAATPDPSDAAPEPLTWWGWTGRILFWAGVVVMAYVVVRMTYEQVLAPFYAPVPAIAVGPETTRFTAPLDDAGFVDFPAALDAERREGVTPENNAAVLLFEALGSREVEQKSRDEFFRRLGGPVPPEKGAPFHRETETPPVAADQKQLRHREHFQAWQRPWKRAEFPAVAEWVAANEAALAKFVAASQRPGWYAPFCAQDEARAEGAGSVTLVYSEGFNHAYQALLTRAMLRVGEGEFDAAWADTVAADALGRHIAKGWLAIDWLVGMTVCSYADVVRRDIALDPRLTAADCKKFRERYAAEPKFPADFEKLTRVEQVFFISQYQSLARDKSQRVPPTGVDWNVGLKAANERYDRLVAAFALPDRFARRKALVEWSAEVDAYYKREGDWSVLGVEWLAGRSSRAVWGERVAADCLSLYAPNAEGFHDIDLRGQARRDLTRLVFVLREFQFARGKFPATLAELVPDFLAAEPDDLTAPQVQSYGYRRTAAGFVLSSELGSQPAYKGEFNVQFPAPPREVTP